MMILYYGRCKDVLAYPHLIASYAVSVRQYRILPFGFVTPFGRGLRFAPAQCMGRPKPPFRQLADNATGRYPGT
jgi:hypothetical protein